MYPSSDISDDDSDENDDYGMIKISETDERNSVPNEATASDHDLTFNATESKGLMLRTNRVVSWSIDARRKRQINDYLQTQVTAFFRGSFLSNAQRSNQRPDLLLKVI